MLVRGNRRFYESADLGFQPLYVMEKTRWSQEVFLIFESKRSFCAGRNAIMGYEGA
jgi:hypothetical protein